jgi:hypothetical protein
VTSKRHESKVRRWTQLLFLVTVVMSALLGCSGPMDAAATGSIVVEREVLLPITGEAKAIVRLADGGFVIAGRRGTAWAVRTNASGGMLWKYVEPPDERLKIPFSLGQSEFDGVVPLENGTLLFCGGKNTPEHLTGVGFLVILDGDGKLIEQRQLMPSGDRPYRSAGIDQCLRWNGDVLLVGGGVVQGEDPFGWLMRLDESGRTRWEVVSQQLALSPAVETADHALVLTIGVRSADNPLGPGGVRVVRVNAKGEVTAARTIPASGYCVAQSMSPRVDVRLISYPFNPSDKPLLYTLNARLQDAAPAKSISPVTGEDLCGYVLDDDSVVLFGRVFDSVLRATVAWVARPHVRDAALAFRLADPRDSASKVDAVVAVSSTEFAAVRYQISPVSPERNGVVMSWVSVRRP